MTNETEAPADPATATADPPVTARRQRLTKPSNQPASVQPSAPAGSAAAVATPTAPGEGDPNRSMSIVTQLMQEGSDETQALLDAVGLRGNLSGEARDIARLIERRLAVIAASQYDSPHAPAIDHLEIQRAFLEHRFVGPLKAYERTLRGYSVLDNFLNVTSIIAGLGGIAGRCARMAQGVGNRRRARRRRAAELEPMAQAVEALDSSRARRERPAHGGMGVPPEPGPLQGQGGRPGGAWKLFCDQIDRVEEREQTEQDKESAEGPNAKGGGKRR